jgi:hypothetical protein
LVVHLESLDLDHRHARSYGNPVVPSGDVEREGRARRGMRSGRRPRRAADPAFVEQTVEALGKL